MYNYESQQGVSKSYDVCNTYIIRGISVTLLALTLPDILCVTLLLGDLLRNILRKGRTFFHITSVANLKCIETI